MIDIYVVDMDDQYIKQSFTPTVKQRNLSWILRKERIYQKVLEYKYTD